MWRDQVKLRYSSTSAEIPKTGQNTRIQRGEQWDLFFFRPTLRCCRTTVVAAPASDGPKHQLPSAFAWVVGHGGCAMYNRKFGLKDRILKNLDTICELFLLHYAPRVGAQCAPQACGEVAHGVLTCLLLQRSGAGPAICHGARGARTRASADAVLSYRE